MRAITDERLRITTTTTRRTAQRQCAQALAAWKTETPLAAPVLDGQELGGSRIPDCVTAYTPH
jgi:hypothetical protein